MDSADDRRVIELTPGKAVLSVIQAAAQTEAVKLALSAFLEGTGLDAEYRLEITARLVRIDKPETDS